MKKIKLHARGHGARRINGPSVIVPEQAYYTYSYGMLDFFRPSAHEVGERFWHEGTRYEVVENYLMRGDAETASVHRFEAVKVSSAEEEKAWIDRARKWAGTFYTSASGGAYFTRKSFKLWVEGHELHMSYTPRSSCRLTVEGPALLELLKSSPYDCVGLAAVVARHSRVTPALFS